MTAVASVIVISIRRIQRGHLRVSYQYGGGRQPATFLQFGMKHPGDSEMPSPDIFHPLCYLFQQFAILASLSYGDVTTGTQ
ncbi:hypothetical protein IF2G_04014 [Cordyceps javanica]|nr:hypothetical protein IF2G_04014 [Cordyceps javanica]